MLTVGNSAKLCMPLLVTDCGCKTNKKPQEKLCQIWSRLVVAVGHPAGGANMAPGGGTKGWRCVDGVLPGSDHVSFQHFIVKG